MDAVVLFGEAPEEHWPEVHVPDPVLDLLEPHVLAEEYVVFEEMDDGLWSVALGPLALDRFDERQLRIEGANG